MAMIRIAKLQSSLGHAVEAGDQSFGFEVQPTELELDHGLESGNVILVIMIRRQGSNGRLPAQTAKMGEGLVIGRRGRRGAILRVEGGDQDPLAAELFER